ncbi:uncharacterized protein TEOVI_000744700 [Trypanosoma equiperdum]|uniref:Flagellar attachment zone protein 1 conserved domain-containing protein n=1 Tax=Trypanosoma equiperdum TaxID=5694 RepID=A0A1G4I4S5_TRYEQ|nr:hypothetical protein, conserved [Trypanosoma equiperdum]
MVSSQCVQLQGERLDELLKNKPEELRCAVVVDAANACRVYRDCVSNVTFTPSGRVVEFDVTHPSSIHPSEIAQRLQHYPFRETQRLLLGSSIETNDAGGGNLTMSSFLRRACGVMVDEQGVFVDEVLSRLVIERSSLSSLQCLLVVGFLNRDRIRAKREGDLLDELEERATEHTEMLENMEEMVVLLDEARQAECTVRSELFAREEELLELRCTQDRDKKFRDEMLLSLFNMLEKARSSHVEVARGKVEELMSGVYLVGELEQEVKKLSEENAALREELEQREITHKEDLDALNRKIAALLLELDEKGFEYTDTIGKLDEFVNVLEGARAAEKAALMALEAREQELFDLQDAKDDEMREVEAVMQQLEARIEELQGGMPVPLPWTSSEHLGETGNSTTSAVTVPSASNLAVGGTDIISSMRHQLERLKREKEALMVELQSKGRQHDDVVDELNRNIGGLMTDLDSRIRGCQVSATSAKELLREISLLRSVEEGEDDEDEGDATGCPTTHLGGPWAHH